MGGNDIVGWIAIMMFSVPLSVIWTTHKRKMAEIQMKMQQGGQDNTLRATVEALREEVRALRDTTTQYDLSFDAALQSIESRVQAVERQNQIAPAYRTTAPATEDAPQNLTLGGRV